MKMVFLVAFTLLLNGCASKEVKTPEDALIDAITEKYLKECKISGGAVKTLEELNCTTNVGIIEYTKIRDFVTPHVKTLEKQAESIKDDLNKKESSKN